MLLLIYLFEPLLILPEVQLIDVELRPGVVQLRFEGSLVHHVADYRCLVLDQVHQAAVPLRAGQ